MLEAQAQALSYVFEALRWRGTLLILPLFIEYLWLQTEAAEIDALVINYMWYFITAHFHTTVWQI